MLFGILGAEDSEVHVRKSHRLSNCFIILNRMQAYLFQIPVLLSTNERSGLLAVVSGMVLLSPAPAQSINTCQRYIISKERINLNGGSSPYWGVICKNNPTTWAIPRGALFCLTYDVSHIFCKSETVLNLKILTDVC